MGYCESQEVSGVGSSSVTIAANDSRLNYYPTQLGIPGGREFPLKLENRPGVAGAQSHPVSGGAGAFSGSLEHAWLTGTNLTCVRLADVGVGALSSGAGCTDDGVCGTLGWCRSGTVLQCTLRPAVQHGRVSLGLRGRLQVAPRV